MGHTGKTVGTVGGAAIGSAFGPAGTIVGGALGGIVGGLFDGGSAPAPQIETTSYGGGTGEGAKQFATDESNRVLQNGSAMQNDDFNRGNAIQASTGQAGQDALARMGALGQGAQGAAAAGQGRAGAMQDQQAGLGSQAYVASMGNQGQAQDDRGATYGALGRLQNFYQQGPGPSAAEQQLRMGQQQNAAQAIALAHSGRGAGQNAMAMRNAAFTNAAAGQQTNQQAALLRAQEGQAWRGQQLGAMGMEQNSLAALQGHSLQASGQNQQFATGANGQALGYGQLGATYQGLGNTAQLGYEGIGNNAALGYSGQGINASLGYNQLGQNAYQYGEGMRNNILNKQADLIYNTQATNANLTAGHEAIAQRQDAANSAMMGSAIAGAANYMGNSGGGGGNGGPSPYGGQTQANFYGQGFGNPDGIQNPYS